MKKFILLLVAFVLATGQTNATKVTIKKSKINGDGTGNYKTISRAESSTTNAAGEVHITIQIGCADPGAASCPNAMPVGGGGGGLLDSVDPSVANYLEVRMAEINSEIDGGVLSDENTRIVVITLSNGTQQSYRVNENWDCNSNGDGEITLTIEEI